MSRARSHSSRPERDRAGPAVRDAIGERVSERRRRGVHGSNGHAPDHDEDFENLSRLACNVALILMNHPARGRLREPVPRAPGDRRRADVVV